MLKKDNTTGESVTAQAPATTEATTAATEDVVYYVLGEGGRDRAYLVHIELSVLERYRYAEGEHKMKGYGMYIQVMETGIGTWFNWFMGNSDNLLYTLITFVLLEYLSSIMYA